VERARIESEAEHLTRDCFSELSMTLEDVVTSVELCRAAAAGEPEDAEMGSTGAGEPANWGETGEEANSLESPLDSESAAGESDIDAARARLDELRIKLDDMGAVNMMALEELEEAEERFKFLTVQRTDILDSIRMTEEALSEIKRRSRERF